MKKTDIEWADMTWNPVTGCLHGCEYCYARKIAARFGGNSCRNTSYKATPFMQDGKSQYRYELDKTAKKYDVKGKLIPAPYPCGFEPTFHRYRLDEPYQKRGQTIFVCSMADLFGEWVPDEWIEEVFAACRLSPQHRYLFLTKNPARYLELDKTSLLPHQDNFWYGSTVPDETARAMCPKADSTNTFWSMEPLLGPVDISKSEGLPQWIILGAMTGPGNAKWQPERKWLEDIMAAADGAGIPVFTKNSLIPIVGEDKMRREFPWTVQKGVKS